MANAIKKISVQRGYDVTEYTLNCFGGAGGQHACLVADALGMERSSCTRSRASSASFTRRPACCRPTAWASLVASALSVEAVGHTFDLGAIDLSGDAAGAKPLETVQAYMAGARHDTPVYDRDAMAPGQRIKGPAILIERTGTNVVEPGWEAELTDIGNLVLTRVEALPRQVAIGTDSRSGDAGGVQQPLHVDRRADGLHAAEHRLFGEHQGAAGFLLRGVRPPTGQSVANAPHMPVHLGSMGESVKAVIRPTRDMARATSTC
jgi:hypothetical protein